MHTRRILTAILGAWLVGSGLISYIATSNFEQAASVLQAQDPKIRRMVQTLGEKDARHLLRHEASEMNRAYFVHWQRMQLLFLILVIVILVRVRAKPPTLIAAGLLTLATLANYFAMTPQIIGLGRLLDFAAPEELLPERSRFGAMHQAYGIVELVKVAMATVLLFVYSWRTSKRRVSPKSLIDEVDEIEDADDRHVNR